jgi:hypothetical protein
MSVNAILVTDCPICGVRLRVPVLDDPGAVARRTVDAAWLAAHFRTHGPDDGGEPQAIAA